MKHRLFTLTLFVLPLTSFANEAQLKAAYHKAIGFGNAVYCEATPLVSKQTGKNVFVIEKDNEQGTSSYAVSYYADCQGGSGTMFARLTPVHFGGNVLMEYGYVDVQSEQDYDLFSKMNGEINPRFIEKIVQKKIGVIEIIGSEFAANDGNQFPSLKYRYEVKLPEMKVIHKSKIN